MRECPSLDPPQRVQLPSTSSESHSLCSLLFCRSNILLWLVIRSFIKMVCIESRCQLDVAEHECLMCLMLFLVNTRLQPECGIESNIDHYYGEFRTVPRWNMCYASAQYYSSSCLNIFPSTLIEHMMLGNFTSIPSIAHYVP